MIGVLCNHYSAGYQLKDWLFVTELPKGKTRFTRRNYVILSFQDYGELAGPEEMKWPQKSLHTYNVQNGDSFILDEKVPLHRIRTTSRSSVGSGISGSPSPRIHSSVLGDSPKIAITFSMAPGGGFFGQQSGKKGQKYSGPKNAGEVARNLFGKTQKVKSPKK